MDVLIVDDHPVVRSGLRRLLSAESEIEIREARTGQEALDMCAQSAPDLVVLDLNLPDVSGIEVIHRIKASSADTHILVLSVHDNPVYVTRVLESGATGYVTKNTPADELLDAVRRVAGGASYIEREIAQQIAVSSIRDTPHPLKRLSPRDIEILRLLGDGYSLLQIADAIDIGYKTVANHCTLLKSKLGVTRTADLIRIAISHGLSNGDPALPDEDDPQS